MFTGIIEAAGEVVSFVETEAGGRLVVRAPGVAGELATGESVAVNGCCLTVTETDGVTEEAGFDLLGETLRVTNLGDLKTGDKVNLERALRVGDRMSGHMVQGHVDCVSRVVAFEKSGEDHRLEIALPEPFARYVVFKGSIAVDGISLTVANVTLDPKALRAGEKGAEGQFTVWIIPHTFAVTNLRAASVDTRVNLEFDVLAKYVEKQVGAREAH